MPPVTVSAVRMVPHPPERVYAFVAQLGNHWHLNDRSLRLDGLNNERSGGRIVISGPLGLRRTAWTTVTTEDEPREFGGILTVGRRTSALTRWRIEPMRHGARVVLESSATNVGVLDRLLLGLGGRWWLRRGFTRVLARLAERLDISHAATAEQPDDAGPRTTRCGRVGEISSSAMSLIDASARRRYVDF